MKKTLTLLLVLSISFISCGEDNDDNLKTSAKTTFNFKHDWDGTAVASSDFENTPYTNANREILKITRLRYVISDVTFTKSDGSNIVIEGHKLVDLTNDDLNYSPLMQIPLGTYTNVSFTYGFTHEKNTEGAYPDLNSTSFNVPAQLGGGYHYMQFDGTYSNTSVNDAPFNYHNIRAATPGMTPTFPEQDTYITVNLGPTAITNDTTIDIKMNIAEWFKSPNTWDLNTHNQMLMPNPAAQKLMNENGQNVFSLGAITQ